MLLSRSPWKAPESPWVVNREMMRLVTSDVVNTGMVVAIDTGDQIALHPQNKKPIGVRHACLALKETYGRDIVGSGPRLQKQRIEGSRIVLQFDSIGSGLVPANPSELNSFAIAGSGYAVGIGQTSQSRAIPLSSHHHCCHNQSLSVMRGP